ncbi:hypothetical protein E4U41_007076 [Claviceps citrina]|nr:hypothetical protein E4U41_007076 [Claviceps citrina]
MYLNKVPDQLQSRGYDEVDTTRVYVDYHQDAFTREIKWARGLTLATEGPRPDEVVRALDQARSISQADSPDEWHGELRYGHAMMRGRRCFEDEAK